MEVLGSGSDGNCYLLRAGNGEVLMLEAGVGFTEVKKALGWSLRGLVGCVVSHRHGDHAKYLPDTLRCGVRVLALPDVTERLSTAYAVFAKAAEPMKGYRMGGFRVLVLPVEHDVPCAAFAISHPEMGRLLFATDTAALRWRVEGLTQVMIEANYCPELLQRNVESGVVPTALALRLSSTHMSIGCAAEWLRRSDLSQVSNVVLLHLSGTNGDADYFRRVAGEACGKAVAIAARGLRLDFSKVPY